MQSIRLSIAPCLSDYLVPQYIALCCLLAKLDKMLQIDNISIGNESYSVAIAATIDPVIS